MSDRYSRLFARYAAEVDAVSVPKATTHEIRRRLLDSAGVAAAAFDEDSPTAARAYAGRRPGGPGGPGATIWGTTGRADLEAASFANGVAVRFLDFNDTYLSLEPLHPSDVI